MREVSSNQKLYLLKHHAGHPTLFNMISSPVETSVMQDVYNKTNHNIYDTQSVVNQHLRKRELSK